MVTKKPNQSTEILWYEIGDLKEKILSPFKHLVVTGCITDFVLNY